MRIHADLLIGNYLVMLEMHTETLHKIPFSVIGRSSLVPTSHWLQGKCARINLSQAASCMVLQSYRRLPLCIFSVKMAALGPLKLVTGRIFNNFKGTS
jgi:hypothetical protein